MKNILEKKHFDFFLNRGYVLDIEKECQFIINEQEFLFSKLNISGIWSYSKSGCTTSIFENDKSDKIIGFSLDLPKVDFMNEAGLPGFKILDVVEYTPDRFMLCYEMDKLSDIFKYENKELYYSLDEMIEIKRDANQRIDDDIIDEFDEYSHIDACLVNDFLDKYKGFAILDIHAGQFMIDSNEKIWLIDPIISLNISF